MLIGCFWLTSCGEEEDLHLSDKGLADTQPQSTVISLEEAERELISILNELYNPLTRGGEGQIRRIGNAYSRPIGNKATRSSEDEEILIHIINFEDEQGFAIMAGDIRLPSLIALAETGSLNEDEPIDNPGLEIFMDGLNDWTITRPPGWGGGNGGLLPPDVDVTPGLGEDIETYHVYTNWENKLYNGNGLCNVRWGQGFPYNNNCPIKDGQHAVTGCVATAVAQLMSIYRYPTIYNGHTYNWTEMCKYITNTTYYYDLYRTGADDIALLMKELGKSSNLDMDYGKESSGAKSSNIKRTLKSFGYSNGGSEEDYNTSNVASDLKNGYPILLSGYMTQKHTLGIPYYEDGHQWLAHGLMERSREDKLYTRSGHLLNQTTECYTYILCNWGWNGKADGYYLSNCFNPSEGPTYLSDGKTEGGTVNDIEYNFKYKVSSITGIRK